ncbi:hypothetical protein Gotur_005308 [Gossypium turneri]
MWINTCFGPSPSFGILLTIVSLLGELIWSLQWRNTWPYFVARRFKQTKPTRRAVNVPTFLKKLMNITGMSEQWVAARIKQKGDSKFVFPKALGHVDEAVTDLFD